MYLCLYIYILGVDGYEWICEIINSCKNTSILNNLSNFFFGSFSVAKASAILFWNYTRIIKTQKVMGNVNSDVKETLSTMKKLTELGTKVNIIPNDDVIYEGYLWTYVGRLKRKLFRRIVLVKVQEIYCLCVYKTNKNDNPEQTLLLDGFKCENAIEMNGAKNEYKLTINIDQTKACFSSNNIELIKKWYDKLKFHCCQCPNCGGSSNAVNIDCTQLSDNEDVGDSNHEMRHLKSNKYSNKVCTSTFHINLRIYFIIYLFDITLFVV